MKICINALAATLFFLTAIQAEEMTILQQKRDSLKISLLFTGENEFINRDEQNESIQIYGKNVDSDKIYSIIYGMRSYFIGSAYAATYDSVSSSYIVYTKFPGVPRMGNEYRISIFNEDSENRFSVKVITQLWRE
mgnify:FL=1